MARPFDVAIAGAGPAGCAAAIILARAGLRVAIASRPDNAAARIGEGLPPSAGSLLRRLGVQPFGHRVSPGTLAWWGADIPHANDYLFQLHGTGLQLDRPKFDRDLRDAAVASGAVLVPASPMPEADWLIDATGRSAHFARQRGATRVPYDGLIAFYTTMSGSSDADRDGRTLVESTPDGWWYSVLLPNDHRLFAFFCDADLVDRSGALNPRGFLALLRGAPNLHGLRERHGYAVTDRVLGADASSIELDRAAGEGWLAVGDAASAFDPLSSKGISNALYTGIKAAEAILAGAADQYAVHVRDIHRVYRDQLAAFYAMERRWPDAPFWHRRLQSSSQGAAEA